MIDPFDEIIIRNYFSLMWIHQSLMKYRRKVQHVFYLQNMTTHVGYGKLGMFTKGFRPDREVEKLHECLNVIDRRIARNSFRKKHFAEYLAELPIDDLNRLESKYIDDQDIVISERLLSSVLDEIHEIETAICFREGIEPDPERIELTEDVEENLERMCDFFAL